MAIRVAQRTRCLSTAPTGQESTSDTSVIRGILCLVPQSEDACPAVNGAEKQYSVRIIHVHLIQCINSDQCRVFNISHYCMEKSVLLATKPLVDSIRHFIRDPSGVFSVCHLCECRIVQWRHDSRLLLLLNWFQYLVSI